MDDLATVGIDYDDVIEVLENEGVDKFEKSWAELRRPSRASSSRGRTPRERDVRGRRRPGPPPTRSPRTSPGWSATASPAGCSRRTPRCGARTPRRSPRSGCRGSGSPSPRGRWSARSPRCAPSSTSAGIDHVVLCGMGGSSLAPEVICATYGVELTVLDSSHPDQVRDALADRLDRTVVVVSSKSGSTMETDSQKRAYEQAFRDAGIDPTQRIVVVTDPGSPLDEAARADGYRVVQRRPRRRRPLLRADRVRPGAERAGRRRHRHAARRGRGVADLLADDDEANPGLRLGAAIAGTTPLRNKLVLVDQGSGLVGFADWAEQLIAESTGKQGTGLLPVVVADDSAPEVALPPHDVTVAHLADDTAPDPHVDPDETAAGSGRLRRRRHRRRSARSCCCGRSPPRPPAGCSGSTRSTSPTWRAPRRPPARCSRAARTPRRRRSPTARSRSARSAATGSATPPRCATRSPRCSRRSTAEQGYLAVMAYLDRIAHADLADVRGTLAHRVRRPVTFGWGPRFLHSTGQFHKGGPAEGVYLQVTGEPVEDLAVPGKDVHLRPADRRPGRRRRLRARRPRPAGAAAAPHRPGVGPRGAPGSAEVSPVDGSPPARWPTRCATRRTVGMPRIAGPCGLVIFGVTGDLSRKKVMPAIYDLASRGLLPPGFSPRRLRPPGLGRRGLRADRARLRQGARPHRVPRGGLAAARRGLPVRPGRLRRRRRLRPPPADHRGPRPGPRHRRQPRVLPVDPAEVLPRRHRPAPGARPRRPRRTDSWRRVVVEKPFGSDLRSARDAQRHHPRGVPAGVGVPHRPLPRQGDGPEHPRDAVRQHDVRADLERQLRRPRADHDGRGHRHRRPRRLLRRHRRRPRRDPEPPAAADGADRDGGADLLRRATACGWRSRRCSPRWCSPGGWTCTPPAAQYTEGWAGGEKVLGYKQEQDIPQDSTTETYAAIRLDVETRRWAGVPFYLRHRQAARPAGHRGGRGLQAGAAPAVRATPPPRS